MNTELSEKSSRIARNTILLYFRMLLIFCIGIFTSRVILEQLGIEDYGIWNAVGGVVTSFTFLTVAIVNAISRFLAFEIGKGDIARCKQVFATSLIVQIVLSIVLVILVETIGLYLLDNKLNIPSGRETAARFVLHCSLVILVINMLAVPYMSVIVAREKMSAFALISIVEATLKLTVALLLYTKGSDKLVLYSSLMVGVALIVRLCYGSYCRRHFEESKARLCFDKKLFAEMAGFAGWSFVGKGAEVLNVQGVNVLVNVFFGVVVNAARGVATQVEGIVKQFATNFLTALNPQITKSWAIGDLPYCFELVSKGAKFTYLILLAFMVPLAFETELLLELWLKDVPEWSAQFTRLTLIALIIEMTGNSLLTLQLATGKIKQYYLVTGLTSLICLPTVWLYFLVGRGAIWSYITLIVINIAVFILKLYIVSAETGYPKSELSYILLRLLLVTLATVAMPLLICSQMVDGWLRLMLVCASGWLGYALSAWLIVLTKGEKAWLLGLIKRK